MATTESYLFKVIQPDGTVIETLPIHTRSKDELERTIAKYKEHFKADERVVSATRFEVEKT